MATLPPLPPDLAARLDEIRARLHGGPNAVLPVIGSELSEGLPSWRALLAGLIAEVPADERDDLARELDQGHDAAVAGDIEALLGRNRVIAAVARAYQRPRADPPAALDLVAALPVTHFITTAFDPWLKDAVARRHGQAPRAHTPFDPGALSDLDPASGPLVLMAHGDADRPESCALGEAGYRRLTWYAPYRQALAALVATRSLLFIGTSLQDPDLRLVLDEWQEVFGGGGPARHWFLGAGLSPRLGRRLVERGVTPIECGPPGDRGWIGPVLRYLAAPPGPGPAPRPLPEAEAAGYLRRLENETRWADLLGITGGVEALRVPLARLFIPLRAHVSHRAASRRGLEAGLAAPRGVVAALRRSPFLAVIGDPGSGKTTLLRHLAHELARAHQGDATARAALSMAEGDEAPFPVLVPLRHLAAFLEDRGDHPYATDLEEAIAQWAAKDRRGLPAAYVCDAVARRRAALLLDGLDEVPDAAHRRRALLAIGRAAEALSDREGPGLMVVTSRPAAYGGAVRLEDPFEEARLVDLDSAEVERFLEGWIRAVDVVPEADRLDLHPEAARKLGGLLEAIRGNATMDALSRKPVLLTAIALVYHHYGRLPGQRALLYERAIELLLRRFDHHPVWKAAEIRRHLAGVAWHLMESSTPDRLREDEHEGVVAEVVGRRLAGLPAEAPAGDVPPEARRKAGELLEAQELLAGLLRSGEDRRYRFTHRTLQEYLAAVRLADESDAVLHAAVKRRLGEASWRETLRLTAGVLAAHHEGALGRLLAAVVGDRERPLGERLQGVAGAAALLADVEQFDVDPAVLAPIRAERDGLLLVLGDEGSAEELRIGIGEALGRVGDPRLSEAKRWVEVPEGPFWRGAAPVDELADDNEKPGHEVAFVSRFKVQRWPVTVEEFARFVEDKGYSTKEHWEDEEGWAWKVREKVEGPARWAAQRTGLGNVPVTGVSWWEASAYCRWWTAKLGGALEKGLEIRLPTEAEWEKAARGGMVLEEGMANPAPKRVYSWEGAWDARKANVEVRLGGVTPVGCFPGSHGPGGTWDMTGNVWEWCLDWFDTTIYAAYARAGAREKDPAILDSAAAPTLSAYDPATAKGVAARCRVVRGGGWADGAQYARVSFRSWFEPWWRDLDLGFRCVAAPPRPSP